MDNRMIDGAKVASAWSLVGFTYIPTIEEAYQIAQFVALVLAIVMTAQTIYVRLKRSKREDALADMVTRAHSQCDRAQAWQCPLKRELEKLEKLK